jgi:phosphoribosylformimino-5-aminoimidazole carboxamide ribotide isomerase
VELIPVIDLQEGLCVHAQKGLRHLYRPLAQFGDGLGTPHAVVLAYLALAPFRTLYFADLDALTGKPPQWALIESLAENFPELRFWVDAGGIPPPAHLQERITPIVGSESLPRGLNDALSNDVILSLDYHQNALLGGAEILNHADRWPRRVILMSLSLVGSLGGPDFPRLDVFRSQHPGIQFFAAGGIRHAQDLEDLAALGVSGVLLATALHQGALDGATLQRFLAHSDLCA